jgi:small conductance mechanosensitive channel
MNYTIITNFFTTERIIFLTAGAIALTISWATARALHKGILEKTLPHGYSTLFIPLAASIVRFIFLTIGILAFCATIGINISSIIQTIGLLSVGLSFILKDILADVAAGFFILFHRPFHHGHEITLTLDKASYKGKIVSIDLRYTKLENAEAEILIPNSFLFRQPVSITK